MSWVKLHRDLIESQCFAHQTTLKIWLWLLIKANHKNKFVSLKTGRGYTDVNIKRGQLLFGRHKAEESLDIDGNTIYKHIHKLEQWGNIVIESNNQYSIITICKYDEYQTNDGEDEQQNNNQTNYDENFKKKQLSETPITTNKSSSIKSESTNYDENENNNVQQSNNEIATKEQLNNNKVTTKWQRNGNEVTHTRSYKNVENEENEKNEKNEKEILENSENEFSFKENSLFTNPLFGQEQIVLNGNEKNNSTKMKKTTKADPLYEPFMKFYYEWVQTMKGFKPQVDGGDGKALNQIIKYFRGISQDDVALLQAWEAIFNNYNKWDKFHQGQIRLRQVNSNLTNIINTIKNGKTSTGTKSIAEMRQEIGDVD